jgi:lysophospholipase L1-like esterase
MAIFSDTFTVGVDTTLASLTPVEGTGYTLIWSDGSNPTLVANATGGDLRGTTANNSGCVYTFDATYPSADYENEFELKAAVAFSTRPFYAFVRLTDIDNMYAVRLTNVASGGQLYKKVGGTWTALGSAFSCPAAGSVCKLEIIGSALKFYDDGVEVASVTDGSLTSAGEAGFGLGGGAELVTSTDDANSAWQIDTLVVSDLGGGGGGGVTGSASITGADGSVSASGTVVGNTGYNVGESNIFFSPANWVKNGTSWAQTVNPGAYMKFKFNGTGLSVDIDVSVLRAAGITSTNFPKVAYRVDGGSYSSVQLSDASDTLTVTVASGLSLGEHTAEFYLAGVGGNDRWSTPTNHLRVTGITVAGGTLSVPTLRSKRWLIFGDSISYGVNALGTTESYSVANKDATKAWGILLAEALDAEVGIVGFVGQGWDAGGGGSTGVPEFHVAGGNNTWDEIYSGQARSFAGIDRVFVNHGTNDGDSASVIEADVEDFLADFRAANPNTWLVIVLPFDHSNSNKTPITDGFNDYRSSTGDGRVVLIEANPAADVCQEMDAETYPNGVTYTSDSMHPNTAGNIALADLLEADFGSALGYVSATGADGTVSASGTVGTSEITASASITGDAGSVSSDADVLVAGSSSITGADGSVSSDADVLISGSASLTGADGAVSSEADALILITSSLTGSDGVVSGDADVLVSASASLTGADGSVSADGSIGEIVTADALITGEGGSVSADADVLVAGSSSITGADGSVSASGNIGVFILADALITGDAGSVSAVAAVAIAGSSALTGEEGTVSALAGVLVDAGSLLDGSDGSVSADAGVLVSGLISITGEDGTASALASVSVSGLADITGGAGSVSSDADVLVLASASLAGADGTIIAAVGSLAVAEILITGDDGTVSALASVSVSGLTSITGEDGTAVALAGVVVSGNASLTGDAGSVSSEAGVAVIASAALTGEAGTVSIAASPIAGGSVAITGEDGSASASALVLVSGVVSVTGANGTVHAVVGVVFSVDLLGISEINRSIFSSSEIDPTDSVMMSSSEINRKIFSDGSLG